MFVGGNLNYRGYSILPVGGTLNYRLMPYMVVDGTFMLSRWYIMFWLMVPNSIGGGTLCFAG